jgi:serine/threonine protein kinase
VIREAKVMQRIQPHRYVLQMIAVCTEKIKLEGSIYLLTEFCAGGELGQYLREFTEATPEQLLKDSNKIAFQIQPNTYMIPIEGKGFLENPTLLSYCLQIASGMDYLTSIPVLHRDLGP